MVAGGLIAALLIVIVADKLMSTDKPEGGPSPEITQQAPKAKPLRLAVVKPPVKKDDPTKFVDDWDDMGKLLDHLGEGYKYTTIPIERLADPKTLEEVDVLFLTCSSQGNTADISSRIRQFVTRGGTLYASDWRYLIARQAFPDMVDKRLEGEGKDQHLQADVMDPGLADALGMRTVPLKFDLDQWKVASFAGDKVKVLMKARYKTQQDGWAEAPLLVKFPYSLGTVIFTSFHNEHQNSEVETKLLKYLVFSAVTAKTENEINQTMLKGGFSPQKSNLLSASKGSPEVTQRYQSKKAGAVSFVLGFEDQGAKLKLTVVSPQGKETVKEGTSTITIEETSPAVGEWRYTVTALSVPFPDFPFTVTVGEK